MNTKGLMTSTIIKLILLVLGLVVISGVITYLFTTISQDANKRAIQEWIIMNEATKKGSAGFITMSDIPPISVLHEKPIIITQDDLKIQQGQQTTEFNKKLSDEVYDCWDAFFFGEKEFKGSLASTDLFCFQCAVLTPNKEIKTKSYKAEGFYKYLSLRKLKNGESIYKSIYKDEKLPKDEIVLNDNLYIYFIAGTDSAWYDAIEQTILSEAYSDASWFNSNFNLISISMNFVMGLKDQSQIWKPTIFLGSKEQVLKLCS